MSIIDTARELSAARAAERDSSAPAEQETGATVTMDPTFQTPADRAALAERYGDAAVPCDWCGRSVPANWAVWTGTRDLCGRCVESEAYGRGLKQGVKHVIEAAGLTREQVAEMAAKDLFVLLGSSGLQISNGDPQP